jgi:hypothetical protein
LSKIFQTEKEDKLTARKGTDWEIEDEEIIFVLGSLADGRQLLLS